MEKVIRWVFLAFSSICGILAGWNTFLFTSPMFKEFSKGAQAVNAAAFIIAGLTISAAIGSICSDFITKTTESITKKILAMPYRQLAGTSAGIAAGLLISSMAAYILSAIPFDLLPFGRYIYALSVMLITIFSCYISAYLGARIIGKAPVSAKILKSPKGLDMFWGNKHKILDTSVIIDGRIQEIAKTGFIEGTLLIPRFVLTELQALADSGDDIKRAKGRRGLDLLEEMKKDSAIEIAESDYGELPVDDKLIKLASEIQAPLLTMDFNLNKVAKVQGIDVLNINDLSNALKPSIVPGEIMKATVIKEGKEQGQGVAYMPNGTMIVIENGRKHIGEEIVIEATSCIQTSAGKMIFAKII